MLFTACTKTAYFENNAVASVQLTYLSRPGFALIGDKSTGDIAHVEWQQYFPSIPGYVGKSLGNTLNVNTDFIMAESSFTYYFRLTITAKDGTTSIAITSIHIN
jgi:hypothetical protein